MMGFNAFSVLGYQFSVKLDRPLDLGRLLLKGLLTDNRQLTTKRK